ncbi:MAG: hypothetical protein ACYC6W_03715 [Nitrosotalea sp.]
MAISTYGLIILVILATSTPALALAERHDVNKRELYDLAIPNLVLVITIAAIVSIIATLHGNYSRLDKKSHQRWLHRNDETFFC